MMTPGWLLDIFAALMLAVAAVSAARLALARPWQHGAAVAGIDIDITHLLMGIAMAGMLAASLTTLPSTVWEACFAAATAWFGYRVVRDARANGTRALAGGHCAPHLVHSAAMLYMYLALTAPAAGGGTSGTSGTSGMGGSSGSAMQSLSLPTLAFAFALVLIGYSVWDIDQLSGRRYALAVAADGVPGAAAVTVIASTSAGAAAEGRSGARAVLLSPGITVGCRIAMGVTMALMLLIMI